MEIGDDEDDDGLQPYNDNVNEGSYSYSNNDIDYQ